MKYTKTLVTLAALAIALPAQAATMISDAFTRVSPQEDVTALFTAPSGTSTTGSYTGFVEVLISGTGNSNGNAVNDAFYYNGGGVDVTGFGYYRLGIGTSVEPLAAFNPSRFAGRMITFIDGVGPVASPAAPAYNPSHEYNFVIDLGALDTQLSFGVLDGNFADNAGQYNVSVWQLVPGVGAVPEPATWAMMIIGMGAAGTMMRRRKKQNLAIA